jgi:hypothetical protein
MIEVEMRNAAMNGEARGLVAIVEAGATLYEDTVTISLPESRREFCKTAAEVFAQGEWRAGREVDGEYLTRLPEQLEQMLLTKLSELRKNRTGPGPILTCLADVEPKEIDWLWLRRIALGKLTLIAGDPGLGKSFVTLDMIAKVTTGSPWPDGSRPPIGDAILITAEDDLADTIRPRLDAAGADVRRVVSLRAIAALNDRGKCTERSFTLADIPHLADALNQHPECRLVVIDPVSAFLGGKDGHRNDEIRGLLAPLARLAADHRVAIVMVTHLSKGGSSGRAMYRAMGSLAFAAAARAAYLVIPDEAQPTRRLMLPIKNNVGNDRDGFAYTIQGEGMRATVVWEKTPVTITADQALAASTGDGTPGPDPEALDAAKEFLVEMLAQGPVPAGRAEAEAKQARVSGRTLRRAKAALGVRSIKDRYTGMWMWRLPDPPRRADEQQQDEEQLELPPGF